MQSNLNRVFIVTFLILSGVAQALEHVAFAPNAQATAQQWEVLDIHFSVEPSVDLPAIPEDASFSAKFQHESGKSLEVAGFFNGSRSFVIRFTPPLSGTWDFVTASDVAALNQLSGSVIAEAAAAGRRGGIRLDPESKTRFRYEDGTAYFPIAFESDWLFALDAENKYDIPVTRTLVDSLAENGFNQIVMNVFAYDVNWKKDASLKPEYDYGSPRVFPFGGTNEEPDYERLNIEYFQRLDRVIDYLDHRGIVAHLMIYVWNKKVNWPAAGSEADNRYFDYVARRYQAFPNLIWDISKEALGYGHNDVEYITDRIKRLREQNAYQRLITVHDYGYCRRFPQHVDFVSVQLWSSELFSVMREVRKNIPDKPILNIEHGGYERGPYVVFTGAYTSPETCLERAYQCVFAGTYPTHYWQGAAWNVVIPHLASLPAADRPRLEYYRHLNTLVNKYDLSGLIAGEKKSNAGFALHNKNDLFIYYVPRECEFIGIRLPQQFRGGTMEATWFNPFDGTFSAPVTEKVTQWPSLTVPEGDGFRVVIVKARRGQE